MPRSIYLTQLEKRVHRHVLSGQLGLAPGHHLGKALLRHLPEHLERRRHDLALGAENGQLVDGVCSEGGLLERSDESHKRRGEAQEK